MIRTDDDEAKIAEYQELALEIGIALGAVLKGARFKQERENKKRFCWEHSRQTLTLANGREIELHFDEPAGRVAVSGSLPRYLDGQPVYIAEKENPAITCSMKRDPAAIARDIENRLIPGFYAAYSKAEDMIAGDLSNVLWTRETATMMIAAGLDRHTHESWEAPDDIKRASARLSHPSRAIQQVEVNGRYRRVSYEIRTSRQQRPEEAIREMEQIAEVLKH